MVENSNSLEDYLNNTATPLPQFSEMQRLKSQQKQLDNQKSINFTDDLRNIGRIGIDAITQGPTAFVTSEGAKDFLTGQSLKEDDEYARFSTVLGNSFRLDTIIGRSIEELRLAGAERDPDWEINKDNLPLLTEGLREEYWELLEHAQNAEHAQTIRRIALEQQAMEDRLMELGWAGLGVRMGTMVADPVALALDTAVLTATGGAGGFALGPARRLSRLESAARTSAGLGISVTAQMAYLNELDPTMTGEDVVFGSILGAAIGAGFGAALPYRGVEKSLPPRMARSAAELRRDVATGQRTATKVADPDKSDNLNTIYDIGPKVEGEATDKLSIEGENKPPLGPWQARKQLPPPEPEDIPPGLGADAVDEPSKAVIAGDGVPEHVSDFISDIHAEARTDGVIDINVVDEIAEEAGTKFAVAGVKSRTANKQKLKEAQDLEASGASAAEIRDKTGWYKKDDGNWRYWIDDRKATIPMIEKLSKGFNRVVKDLKALKSNNDRTTYRIKKVEYIEENQSLIIRLGELFKHPQLYEAYPVLKNLFVSISPDIDGTPSYYAKTRQGLDIENDFIQINTDFAGNIKTVLVHEITHVIQNIEGLPGGASLPYRPTRLQIAEYLVDAGEAEARSAENALLPSTKNRPEIFGVDFEDIPRALQGLRGQRLGREISKYPKFERQVDKFYYNMLARSDVDRKLAAKYSRAPDGKKFAAITPKGNGKYSIQLSPDFLSLPRIAQMEVIAEEYGHFLEMEVYAKLPEAEKAALKAEWQKARKSGGLDTNRDVLRNVVPSRFQKQLAKALGSSQDELADTDYMASFSEWKAKNIARSLTASPQAVQALNKQTSSKFWKRLAKIWENLVRGFRKSGYTNKEIDKFLKSQGLDTAFPEVKKAATAEPPKAPPRHLKREQKRQASMDQLGKDFDEIFGPRPKPTPEPPQPTSRAEDKGLSLADRIQRAAETDDTEIFSEIEKLRPKGARELKEALGLPEDLNTKQVKAAAKKLVADARKATRPETPKNTADTGSSAPQVRNPSKELKGADDTLDDVIKALEDGKNLDDIDDIEDLEFDDLGDEFEGGSSTDGGSSLGASRVPQTGRTPAEKRVIKAERKTERSYLDGIRYDMSARMKRSPIKIFARLGALLVEDPVGNASGKAVDKAVTRQVNRFRRIQEAKIGEVLWPAWRKAHAAGLTDENKFMEEVGRAITKKSGTYKSSVPLSEPSWNNRKNWTRDKLTPAEARQEVDQAINELANAYREGFAATLAKAKELGMKHADQIDFDDQYFSRIYDPFKLNAVIARYGADAVEDLFAEAIIRGQKSLNANDKQGVLTRLEARMVGRSVIKKVQKGQYGHDDIMALRGNNQEALAANLRETLEGSVPQEDLEALIRKITARVKQSKSQSNAGKVPRFKYRIRLDEDTEFRVSDPAKNQISVLKFDDILERNAEVIFGRYIRQINGRAHLEKALEEFKLDPADETPSIETLIQNAMEEAGQKGITPEDWNNEVALIRAAVNVIEGRPPTKPGSISQELEILRAYNFSRVMNLVGLSQLSELFGMAGEMGYWTTIQALPTIGRYIASGKRFSEASELASELHQMNYFTSERIRRPLTMNFDDYGAVQSELRGSGREAAGTTGPRAEYLKARAKTKNFLRQANVVTSEISMMATVNQLTRAWAASGMAVKFHKIANGRASLTAKRLATLGLNPEKTDDILDAIRTHAEEFPDGSLRKLNIDRWDPQARGDFEFAMDSWMGRIVQEQDLGTMALWMTGDLAKTVIQFRTFMIGAYTKQTLYGAHLKDLQTFQKFMGQTIGAMLGFWGFVQLSGIGRPDEWVEERLEPFNFAKSTLQRSGYSSLMPGVVDTIVADGLRYDPIFAYGRSTGLSSGFGVGNPTFDLFDNARRAVGGGIRSAVDEDYDFSQQEGRNAKALLLFQNFAIVHGLANVAINDLPETPKQR